VAVGPVQAVRINRSAAPSEREMRTGLGNDIGAGPFFMGRVNSLNGGNRFDPLNVDFLLHQSVLESRGLSCALCLPRLPYMINSEIEAKGNRGIKTHRSEINYCNSERFEDKAVF
jgi:hypothetical protein